MMRTARIYWLSRSITVTVVVASMGALLIKPRSAVGYVIDILFRSYVIFLGTVMAHEGIHGNLGHSRSANQWWGRIALLPSMVPFTNFRKTHQLHHAFTNIPGKDPDYFVRPRHVFEIPLRAVAMPHHWFFWLWKRGDIDRHHTVELIVNYAGIFAAYALLLSFTGPWRLVWGMVPSLILVSILLWYPFAVKTHDGYSTGSPEMRSHNYYGRFMYWFSLGLSMHRAHHAEPHRAWIELKGFVENDAKGGFLKRLLPHRDIRVGGPSA
jgi:fatty acid desaturase